MVKKNMLNDTASLQLPLPEVTGQEWPMTSLTKTFVSELPVGPSWPKISIVTPSYNQGPYLEKTIRSVLLQGYPNIEYILIDGGSTDQSVDIIRKYEPWIDFWVSENDRGQSHAINKGFQRATGELFCWLNSDDYFAEGALFAVAEAYQRAPSTGAIVGAGQMVDESGNLLHLTDSFDVTVNSLCRWVDRFFWQPSCFFSKNAWEQCGPLEENLHFAMDLDLWFKIAKKFPFTRIDSVLSTSLMHTNAKTNALTAQTRVDAALVILNHGGEKEAREYLLDYMNEKIQWIAEQDQRIAERDQRIEYLEKDLDALFNSLSWKITAPLRKIADKTIIKKTTNTPAIAPDILNPHQYQVRIKHQPKNNRPKVVHALENFMTGGSSRLVVDIFEHLGHLYEQEVITKLNPAPPNFVGIPIKEYPKIISNEALSFFKSAKPDIVHIHFWEETSGNWYEQVFEAAQKFGCKIIENVNTPVKPHFSGSVNHYVYVSDYVYKTFGYSDGKSSVIYPGSNFELFSRTNLSEMPDDVIGMVYRLEPDKLKESSIDVFIKAIQKRPKTKALIVGGGTFLDYYIAKVKEAGLIDSFVFTGYVPYENLPALYAQMSIFVAPVWKESFGQVSPFAMNMGLPVVGYNIGALGEIIDNSEFLAPPQNSDYLSDMIIKLLDQRELRLFIGQANQERAQNHFSVEAMVSSYAKLYSDLLGKKP